MKGTTRWVIPVGPCVIKLPSMRSWRQFLLGMLANLQEREFSRLDKAAWPRELLARVKYCDFMGLCLVMERADYALPSNPHLGVQQQIAEFFALCAEYGLPVDPRPGNIGVFDGEFRLIDYGS